MSSLLTGKTAVVTGGSSGLGRKIARRYAEEGANVVVADVRRQPRGGGEPTHTLITAESDVESAYVDCDVTSIADLTAAVDAAEDLGGIDVMVNNAGVFRQDDFLEVTEDEYDATMNVNVKGVFFGAQQAARRMVEADGGCIINLSSVAGLQGAPAYVTYCTSKGAVRLLTYALAARLGPEGIRVNAIHPGITETSMTTEDVEILGTEQGESHVEGNPLGRAGQPADIAEAAVFLASDRSSYVNGESLVVDGGASKKA